MSLLAYTISDQQQMDKAQYLGLDGVFVDDPYLN